MTPLSIIYDIQGAWIAAFFLLIFFIKFILSLLGGEVDADSDGDCDIDSDSPDFGISYQDFLSFKGFLNFGVGFSVTWALFGIDSWWKALLCLIVGFISTYLLIITYKKCMKLEEKRIYETAKDLINRQGSVYSIFEDCIVVQMSLNGRMEELVVYSKEPYDSFHVGEKVYVSEAYDENDMVLVYVKHQSSNKPSANPA